MMQITVIDSITAFDELKDNWEQVYREDVQATIFLSWAWLRGYLVESQRVWFVLAARPVGHSDFVAFLPLAFTRQFNGVMQTLEMAGNPESDYTGFICLPAYTEKSLAAFAAYIQQQLVWDRFNVRDVQDDRLDAFLWEFPTDRFQLLDRKTVICPYIPLPDNWEDYLQTLSWKARREVRRALRDVKKLPAYRHTVADTTTFDVCAKALQELWSARWGDAPYNYSDVLGSCWEHGNLWLSVLWSQDTPIATLAGLVDNAKGRFYSLMGTFNNDFRKYAPGKAMDALSIQYAISRKLKVYDYLRGDEPYKFRLGAVEGFNTSVTIWRRTLKSHVFGLAKSVRQLVEI